MMNYFMKPLMGYLRLNRRWILPFYIFPFLWRFISLVSNLDYELMNNFFVRKTLLITFLFPLLIAYLLFSAGLGLSFKRKGREGWLSRLPISNSILVTLPLFLQFVFGALIYLLFHKAWEYGFELTGFPIIFLLGLLPLGMYFTVRSIKTSSVGIFVGILISFMILILGDLLLQFLNGDFGLVKKFSILINFSFLRLAIELLCTVLIGFIVIKVEDLPRIVQRSILLMSLSLGLLCIILFVQFQKIQKSYISTFEPLEKSISESEQNKNYCDRFRSFVLEAISGDPAESPLRDRNTVLRAITELKEYPSSAVDKDLLYSYYSNTSQGLAEKLILQKTFRIFSCSIFAKFDLQRGLINSLVKKPSYLTGEDIAAVQQAIWSSLAIPAASSGFFIESMATAKILEILNQHGFIEEKFKLRILEINRDCEEERKKLKDTTSLFAFRAPSLDRIHFIFEAMKAEIQVANLMKNRLNQVIAEIQEFQK